jgi:pyridoxamine--pyruvate transaminase
MGPTARPIYSVLAVTALGGALRALGSGLDVAAGVAAALAVIDDGIDGEADG